VASFQDFLTALEDSLKKLATQDWATVRDAAVKDGQAFFAKARDDLKKWTEELAEGKLSKEDFEDLIKGQRDLAELTALKAAGLAEVKLQQFLTDLVNTIVTTATSVFL
jgi:hypothetical protein